MALFIQRKDENPFRNNLKLEDRMSSDTFCKMYYFDEVNSTMDKVTLSLITNYLNAGFLDLVARRRTF